MTGMPSFYDRPTARLGDRAVARVAAHRDGPIERAEGIKFRAEAIGAWTETWVADQLLQDASRELIFAILEEEMADTILARGGGA